MAADLTAAQVLDAYFLDVRHGMLSIAADLDRIDAADGTVDDDPRLGAIREALSVLTDGQTDRAKRVQMVFSDSYDPSWRS